MNTNKGFVWLPVLLAILGVLAVSGSVYWYGQQKIALPTIAQEQPSQSATTTATNQSKYVFDPASIKIGDQFGSLQVTDVPRRLNDSIEVDFRGKVTVRGTYMNSNEEDPNGGGIGPTYWIDYQDASPFPRSASDDRSAQDYFEILNPEVVGSTIHSRDEVEVTVDQFTYVYWPAEVWNSAHITSIRRISGGVIPFFISPTFGPVPLTVVSSLFDMCQFNTIDWGDGSTAWSSGGAQRTCEVQKTLYDTASHIYTAPGTYTAKLKGTTGTTLGAVVITVTGTGSQ